MILSPGCRMPLIVKAILNTAGADHFLVIKSLKKDELVDWHKEIEGKNQSKDKQIL